MAQINPNDTPNAIVDISQIPIDSLETIRNRLNQVHLSLRKLSDQILHHNRHPNKVKLPNYAHFQNQFQVLITQLHSITLHLENNSDMLQNTNVYPLPSFPTTQQEGLLTTLLRKKPLPEVDEWIDNAIIKGEYEPSSIQKDDEFSQWCSATVQDLRDNFQFWGFQSVEELKQTDRDLLVKGNEFPTKREEENQISGDREGLHPNEVLKFMCQGILT